MLKRIFVFLLYCIFALVLCGVLLVVLFPRERITVWAAQLIEQRLDGFTCSIEDIRYVYPLKLRFYQVRLDNSAKGYQIPVDTLLVGFEPAWPIRRVSVSAVAFGGHLEADAHFNESFVSVNLDNLRLSALRLQDISLLQESIQRPIQGRLDLAGRAVLDTIQPEKSRFSGTLSIEDFAAELRRPIFSVSRADFSRLTAAVTAGDGLIDVADGTATGDLLAGNFSGRVLLGRPWPESSLDLSCGLVPRDSLLNQKPEVREAALQLYKRYRSDTIPCLVEGTFRSPEFRFGEAGQSGPEQTN